MKRENIIKILREYRCGLWAVGCRLLSNNVQPLPSCIMLTSNWTLSFSLRYQNMSPVWTSFSLSLSYSQSPANHTVKVMKADAEVYDDVISCLGVAGEWMTQPRVTSVSSPVSLLSRRPHVSFYFLPLSPRPLVNSAPSLFSSFLLCVLSSPDPSSRNDGSGFNKAFAVVSICPNGSPRTRFKTNQGWTFTWQMLFSKTPLLFKLYVVRDPGG